MLQNIDGLSIEGLKRVAVLSHAIPAEARAAAIRLYELGEQDFALAFLIQQLELYKDPEIHENVKRETCLATAIALGRLRDERAITPLFEGLGKLSRCSAAYALAQIDGAEVEKNLVRLMGTGNPEAINATIALGFLKRDIAVPTLVELYRGRERYKERYDGELSLELFDNMIFYILGAHPGNELAETVFRNNLTPNNVEIFLHCFVGNEAFPQSYIVTYDIGWQIVKKYRWDAHLNTHDRRDAFMFNKPADADTINLRAQIVNEIWESLSGGDVQ